MMYVKEGINGLHKTDQRAPSNRNVFLDPEQQQFSC